MKILKNNLLLFLFIFSFSFLIQDNISAHTARTDWTSGCTTPGSNYTYGSGNVNTSTTPSYGTSYKYGTVYYHWYYTNHDGDKWVPGYTSHSKDKWVPGYTNHSGDYYDSKTKTTNHSADYWVPGYTDHSADYWVPGYTDHSADYEVTVHDSYGTSDTCSASRYNTSTSGDRGTVSHYVKYTDSYVSTSYQTHYTYFVTNVSISLDTKSYEDETMPSPSCTKTYANGHQESCTSGLSVTKDQNTTTQRYTCYKYTENGYSDEKCTTRVYVDTVDLTGPQTTYTGEKFTYSCVATFYDGTTKNVSTYNNIWSATPYDYMGDNYAGYVDNRGTRWTAGGTNVFYPADPNDRTYTLKCRYYPNSYTQYSNSWISDNASEKSDTLTVNHNGISEINVDVSGQFLTSPNRYTQVNNLVPNSSSQWNQYDFITGHWYNFRAMLTYSDGRKRNVTSANEIYWTSSPWYTFTPSSSDTGMSQDGNDHRIPANGWNSITVKYFNDNVPYGSSSYGKTRLTNQLWSHQIKQLEIRGTNYATNPKLSVVPDETVQYTAWVIWSDYQTNPFNRGTHENWTSVVYWDGDYKIGNGIYKFAMKGTNEKATVWARIVDTNRLFGTHPNWDDHYDKKEITITGCNGVTHLAWNCPTPPNYWAIDPLQGFGRVPSEPGHDYANFLPPPQQMGFSSWNDDNNPYFSNHEFSVSGFSSGTGGKNDSSH